MATKERLCSFRYCANLEEWLLFRKARLFLLYLFLKAKLFVLCMLACNQERPINEHLKTNIFQVYGICVLGSFVWCYLQGMLFLCLGV